MLLSGKNPFIWKDTSSVLTMCHENVGLVFADCTDCPQSTNISQNHEKSCTAHWTSQKLTRFSLENDSTCMWIKPQFSSSIRIRPHSNGAGGGMAFPNHFQCTAPLCFTQHVLKFESFPSPLSLTFCSVNRKSPKIIPGRNSNATKMQKINFNSSQFMS